MQNKPSTVVEYIWLGADNEIRSKTRVLYDLISNDIEEIPVWNFDGSSHENCSFCLHAFHLSQIDSLFTRCG